MGSESLEEKCRKCGGIPVFSVKSNSRSSSLMLDCQNGCYKSEWLYYASPRFALLDIANSWERMNKGFSVEEAMAAKLQKVLEMVGSGSQLGREISTILNRYHAEKSERKPEHKG